MSETTEIATIVDAAPGLGNELANLSAGRLNVFSTITGTDFASRVKVINALTAATPVAGHLNKVIELKDVVIQSVTMPDQSTGELSEVPRVTLIAEDGTAFSAMSGPLYKDLKNVFAILGMPHEWPSAVPVKVTQGGEGVRKYFTLTVGK